MKTSVKTKQPAPMLSKLSDSSIDLETSGTKLRRTRRQRILEKISFETECHNIYDPVFTSEDEISENGMTTRRKRHVEVSSGDDSLMSESSSSEEQSIGEMSAIEHLSHHSSQSSIDIIEEQKPESLLSSIERRDEEGFDSSIESPPKTAQDHAPLFISANVLNI